MANTSEAEAYLKRAMKKRWVEFWETHPELAVKRGTMLQPFVTLLPTEEIRKKYNKLKNKEYIQKMKRLYKIGGWSCLLVGVGCLWGIGAVAILSGLTLFWIGANIDDAKCYKS